MKLTPATRFSEPKLFPSTLAVIVRFSLAAAVWACRADSWLPPHTFDTVSENKQYVARITPASKGTKASLTVFAVRSGRSNQLWQVELSNRIAPSTARISDDGMSVVTLDNWGGVGYGDDVVGIYGQSARLAIFSLEQLAPPKASDRGIGRDNYFGRFSHTTSSRHWREASIEFFLGRGSEKLFCLWLDWDNRWLVWRMNDGRNLPVDSDLSKRLDLEGRRRVLQTDHAQTDPAAMNFLGRLRFHEDRPRIEAWLSDTNFSAGHQGLEFFSYSDRRQKADQILARWDGIPTNQAGLRLLPSRNRYRLLGNVKGRVRFPVPPSKGEGSLRFYLIPESTPLARWSSTRPVHYLIADLRYSYPSRFIQGKLEDESLRQWVDFAIEGVTPGNYRLKVVWDKSPPHTPDHKVVCQPMAGDFESESSPVVSVRRGEEAKNFEVDCVRPVTN